MPKKYFSASVNVTEALLIQFPDRAMCNVSKINLLFSFRSVDISITMTRVFCHHANALLRLRFGDDEGNVGQ